MYAQCGDNRNEYLLLDELVDYHKDKKVISFSDQQLTIQGRPITYITTAGWHIFCQQKLWEKLSDLREYHPMQTAEFAAVQGTHQELAFN